jgi:hypothetical protein
LVCLSPPPDRERHVPKRRDCDVGRDRIIWSLSEFSSENSLFKICFFLYIEP